jgi:hypothetical protein
VDGTFATLARCWTLICWYVVAGVLCGGLLLIGQAVTLPWFAAKTVSSAVLAGALTYGIHAGWGRAGAVLAARRAEAAARPQARHAWGQAGDPQ